MLIAGAAGRDFHNFNLVYRDRPEHEVVAFTATQIPNIDGRRYPVELAGSLYPDGIPILPESALEECVREHEIDEVVFAYSDVTHEHVMHIGSRALAAGASYRLISPRETMLPSSKPAVAICAVRTGSGKSQTTRRVAELLRAAGKKVAVLRHPDAVRRPREAGRAAVRALRGSRGSRRDDRGARGIRTAPRRGQPRVRRNRLREDPPRSRAGGRRHPVGRRQQRHAVRQAGPAHRRRRSAPPGPRAALPPG